MEHWNDTCRLMKQADEMASASSKSDPELY